MDQIELIRHKVLHLHQVNGRFVSEGVYNAERNTAKIRHRKGELRIAQQYYSDSIEAILFKGVVVDN